MPIVRITIDLEVPEPADEATGYAMGVLTSSTIAERMRTIFGARVRLPIVSRELIHPCAHCGEPLYGEARVCMNRACTEFVDPEETARAVRLCMGPRD